MRRNLWLPLGLAVATAMAMTAAAADDSTPSYRALGDLAVMHAGRIKPLDTQAREVVKQVYGREAVKLTDAAGKTVATWGPVACLFDWPARPDFWDEQDIILLGGYGDANYQPLKRKVLAASIAQHLKAVADLKTTPAAEAQRLRKLVDAPEVGSEDLLAAARLPGVPADRRKALEALAAKLAPEHKWLSPDDLQTARVTLDDGRKLDFIDWLGEIYGRIERVQRAMGGEPKLSDLEKKVKEVGDRLFHYQAIRDRNARGISSLDILVVPRPHTATYLAYTGGALRRALEKAYGAETAAKLIQSHPRQAMQRAIGAGRDSFTPLEQDAVEALIDYIKDKDWVLPGTDSRFDAKYAAWLRDQGPWVPLRVLVDVDLKEAARAGFDADKLRAFRDAYKAVLDEERDAPGRLSPMRAKALVATARDLGEALGRKDGEARASLGTVGTLWRRVGLTGPSTYPTPTRVAIESHFNRAAPFWWAPCAYGAGLALLLISLGIHAAPGTRLARFDRALYLAGLLAFLGGIGLEVYGFALRVIISGWAPVTNMYETVIWVSLVAAVLGLVLELIYRKKFPATAAAGVALLGTVLAAGFPSVMDPNIRALQPVLRSNYWLTIHVLTEVSSYAAFALAMGLGLIATFYYLLATYRRPVGLAELLPPLLPGIPVMLLGGLGYYAGKHNLGPAVLAMPPVTIGLGFVCIAGMMLTFSPAFALFGELLSRWTVRAETADALDEAAVAGDAASAPALATASAGGTATATATLVRPSVAEIRARAAGGAVKLDTRGRSMQRTAAVVKPLSNYIYRAMQVGVLLITAGTFLGGWWADKSWGRFWGWDPKEVWALITLLVYLAPLHARFAGILGTFGLVAASVGCFMSVLMAWYGVNFVLGVGLHSYGFSEGGGQEGVALVCGLVLAVVFAAGWRRHLGLRAATEAA